MRNYWITVHHPEGYDPATEEDDAMRRDIGALNEEMEAAKVRVFVGGLEPPGNAKTLRRQADGQVLITGGPCLRATEHVCGFWVLKVSSPEEALAWGQKAAIACRAPIEVRAFNEKK